MKHVQHKVWLNGVSLITAVPAAAVLRVYDIEPKETRSAMPVLGRAGGILTQNRRDELTVRVEMAIRERDDREAWTRALSAVRSWCGGGVLEVFDRSGQALDVVCTRLPVAGKKMLDALTAEFTAYALPYWHEKTARTASVTSGTAGSLYVPGDGIETPVDVTFTAAASTTALTVTAGSSSIALTGLSLSQGDTVVIDHPDGFLRIRTGSTNLLSKRTAASSDDLVIPSGATSALTVSAGSAVFSARGCFR